jgi:hypothetical protein
LAGVVCRRTINTIKREAMIERFKTTMNLGKEPSLRFPIGAKVAFTTEADFSGWCAGTVVDQHCEDGGKMYAYVVGSHDGSSLYSDGSLYFVAEDHDGFISDYATLTSRGRHLRFCVGDRVRCHIDHMWCNGTIVQTWWVDSDGAFFPYQICVDEKRELIYCPYDHDSSIQCLRQAADKAAAMAKELVDEEEAEKSKKTKKTEKKRRQRERRRKSLGAASKSFGAESNVSEEAAPSENKSSDAEGNAREESAASEDPTDPPDELRCPITLQLFCDPVIAADGHAYERRAMEDWLARSNRSPRTGAELPHALLTPCHHLRVAADEWRETRP